MPDYNWSTWLSITLFVARVHTCTFDRACHVAGRWETFAKINMGVTLKDIAREAGVNLSTASRSLSGAYGVHPRTREHVLGIAHRLNYRPNRVARGLVTGRSHTLAVVVSDIRNPFFAEVARGAEDAAYAAGCDLVLCNSDLDTAKQVRYIDSLLAKRVDGILMNSVSALTSAQQDQLANCGVPVILLNRSSSRKRFSTILADNTEGGALAAKHLISLGHRRLMHLTGPSQHGNFMDRMKGFLKVTQNAGLPDPIVVRGQHTFSGGYEMAKKALAKNRTATAVFAANDVIAFGCIRAALESGIRIPDELSIIGFDNIEMSQITCPPLTTIHHPKYEIGKSAVEMLLKMAAGEGYEPEHRVIGVRLVQRQSCRDIRPADMLHA